MKFEEIADRHYRLIDIEHGIEFDVRRLHYERHELFGELAVSCGILGAMARCQSARSICLVLGPATIAQGF